MLRAIRAGFHAISLWQLRMVVLALLVIVLGVGSLLLVNALSTFAAPAPHRTITSPARDQANRVFIPAGACMTARLHRSPDAAHGLHGSADFAVPACLMEHSQLELRPGTIR